MSVQTSRAWYGNQSQDGSILGLQNVIDTSRLRMLLIQTICKHDLKWLMIDQPNQPINIRFNFLIILHSTHLKVQTIVTSWSATVAVAVASASAAVIIAIAIVGQIGRLASSMLNERL